MLPDPPGTIFGSAGINDNGDIVGGYTDPGSRTHGFLLSSGNYTTGNYTTLDFPGSIFTTAYGINKSGQIVSAYTNSEGSTFGFLESGGNFETGSSPLVTSLGSIPRRP
jgi:uncharacterized membrane protein